MMPRFVLSVLACIILGCTEANLRGKSFDDLKQMATNPVLRPEIQGKTLFELGGPRPKRHASRVRGLKNHDDKEEQRVLASDGTIKFFTIYDEFGPSVSKIGETAGLHGLVYDMSKYNNGGTLDISDAIGALQGTCSVVGSNNDHFCTYELLLRVDNDFGSVIATGALEFKKGEGGYLIVEAAGDAYDNYNGGLLSLTYVETGQEYIVTGELMLS